MNLVATLFVLGEALSKDALKKRLHVDDAQLKAMVASSREALMPCGLTIVEDANTLRLSTSPQVAELVSDIAKTELEGELTPAALQTLTLVAYMGGVRRDDISKARGVQSNQSLKQLALRGLIEKDKNDHFHLTQAALAHLGVQSVIELPEYDDIRSKLLESITKEA